MTQQPTNPEPNLPGAGQAASAQGVPQPAPGTQAPDTLIGGPMPQPPADPKKRNMGLLIGGLMAIGIAIAILAGIFLTGAFGGSSKVSSYDKFKEGMQEATAGSAASVCADSGDTILESALEESKQQGASDLGVAPEDINIYICSPADLSSFEGMMAIDDSSPLIMGFYVNGASVDENQVAEFSQSDFEGGWVTYGENWMAVGVNAEESLKVSLLDAFNGKEAVLN